MASDIQRERFTLDARGIGQFIQAHTGEGTPIVPTMIFTEWQSRDVQTAMFHFANAATISGAYDNTGLRFAATSGPDPISDVELAYFPENRNRYNRLENILRIHGSRRGTR